LLVTLPASSVRAVQAPAAKHDEQVLADFKARVEKYAELRKKVEAAAPPLKSTANPAEIRAAQTALAERIRAARAGAKPGDIFTPEIAAYFRHLLRPELKEAEIKAAILDDNPGPVPFKVNGPYPEEATLSTVPPTVLKTLPMLPKDIEYRFAGRHLILRDMRANLIIDYMLNAIP
jgi:hypothetical protein